MSLRTTILLAFLLVALAILGLTYWKGGSEPRAEVRELKADAKATKASTAISRDTAEKVEVQGAETRERTRAAQEKIRERIEADPRPAAGADPDVLRVAKEAYDRAVRAACRVQRTSDCPAPADAAR